MEFNHDTVKLYGTELKRPASSVPGGLISSVPDVLIGLIILIFFSSIEVAEQYMIFMRRFQEEDTNHPHRDRKMKDMLNATKFQKNLVWLCFVALASAVFITTNSVQANEPIIKEVEAGKKSFFGKRDFFVSVLHDDIGFEHYADGFEILSVSGEMIAKRLLAHPHVDEQPVTRDLRSVSIADGVREIDVRAHDTVHGYGPKVRVHIPADDLKIKFKSQ